jgi:predicted ATPase
LRLLERNGFGVVEEAATDGIALRFAFGHPTPWEQSGFVEAIVDLQRQRQLARTVAPAEAVFFDRSPICMLALSRYSGLEPASELTAGVDRVLRSRVYEPTVFFVENLGSIETAAARRISFAESLRFERIHRDTYAELGFELIPIPAGGVRARALLPEVAGCLDQAAEGSEGECASDRDAVHAEFGELGDGRTAGKQQHVHRTVDRAVEASEGGGESAARCGQCVVPDPGEDPGRPGVPRIREQQRFVAAVQFEEARCPVSCLGCGGDVGREGHAGTPTRRRPT